MITDREGTLTPDELRTLFLFDALDDEKLTWLSEHGWTASAPQDTVVLAEGEPAELFTVLLEGTVALSFRSGQDEIETVRTDHYGAYAGAVRAYVRTDEPEGDPGETEGYTATLRACTECRFFVLSAKDFSWLMHSWFPMAVHLLDGLFLGMRNFQTIVGQRQQLLALGRLSAGLMHELNNPAAAAVRATSALRERVAGTRAKMGKIAHEAIDLRLLALLVDFQDEAVRAIADAPRLTAVEESRREDEITDWLDEHGCRDGWEIAPIFVAAGLGTAFLERVAQQASEDMVEGATRWLAYTLESELLLNEIEDSVNRVSALVAAAKQYSNMDRSPFERTDLHAGLDSTLAMLNGKLAGLKVVTDYDRELPPVPMYVGEINQVWTNLFVNAAQAMAGQGTLTIRTRQEGDHAVVEVGDTGPGVPEEFRQRIFEPFFTTKPIGQGTGLGLDISYRIVVNRHGGDLRVESVPGDTRFVVRLPLTERA